jgi:ribonuclease I
MRPSDTGRRPAPEAIRSASKLDLPRPVAVRRYVLALGWRPAFTKFTAADSERFRHLFTANG